MGGRIPEMAVEAHQGGHAFWCLAAMALGQRPLDAAWYCFTTVAGMRPRLLRHTLADRCNSTSRCM
jgi:hypothetical protein